jgi:hypothetical protein
MVKKILTLLNRSLGVQVILETLPEEEPREAAGSIMAALQVAGWKFISVDASGGNRVFFEGVDIVADVSSWMRAGDRSLDAAEALEDFLNKNNIKAMRHPAVSRDNLPPNTIKIKVGQKPMTYFLPQEWKDTLKDVERKLREFEEQRKRKQ